MGIFTKDFAQRALGKIQEKRAMQAAVRSNPNATAKDYAQAGMNPLNMMVAKAKAAKAAGAAQPAKPFTPGFGRNVTLDRAATNIFGGSIGNQTAANGTGQSGFAFGMKAMADRRANQMQPTAISPQAFTNQNAISGMFGTNNPGTFTRTVGNGPLAQTADQGQMTSQGYIPPTDPTNPTEQNDVNAVMADTNGALEGYDDASMPPMGVETPITPNYDLNNL